MKTEKREGEGGGVTLGFREDPPLTSLKETKHKISYADALASSWRSQANFIY
jgi:hypothetical protein